MAPVKNKSDSLSEEAALRLIVEGTVSETGTEFFRALVRNLAAAVQTDGAWVTEYLPDANRLRALAFWFGNEHLDDYEHDVPGTPCEAVLTERKLVHYPDRIVEIYPEEPDLRKFNVVSYLGVPLFDARGEIMGHLAVMDTKPLPSEPRIISLFEIFAARAAAELRRLRTERELRAREEQVSALLQSVMDGVVVLDASLRIARVNPAAERLTGYTAEALIGQDSKWFLAGESAKLIANCTKELAGMPHDARHLWIPSQLTVLRADRTRFPAEATLSCFESQGGPFYTLILRNVDDRLTAERQIALLSAEREYLRGERAQESVLGELIGASRSMQEVRSAIKQVAVTDATVLIHGETGTGKELVAEAIHAASTRKTKPLVRVNCAAIPASLMESEFFGHEKGAFTGAVAKREGRFSLADDGTIFLDEVGELPLDLQAKLLRVLQEGEFEPLGSTKTKKVDVRVVAATNRDLAEMVKEGTFREDLYYRLHVFPIVVPPLRERGDDVVLLANAFLQRFSERMGRQLDPLHREDLHRLSSYDWPGNIRELQNVIERAIILTHGTRVNVAGALPVAGVSFPDSISGSDVSAKPRILTVEELEALERENLRRALDACGGKISGASGAAQLLGVPASTFSSRMKALGVVRQGEQEKRSG
ncbi:PAS domain S-box protein [Roseimicrobium sp. ORNL1]|nr:PAS domain S-box protein [Roseimicrobium sp. ORNL1]